MPAPPDPRRSEAFDLFEQSVNVSEVARRFGIPRSTATGWRDAWLLTRKAPPDPSQPSKEEVQAMQIAALESKLKIAEGTAKPNKPVLPPPAPEAGGPCLPKPMSEEYTPFAVDGSGEWLVLCDTHIPYHDVKTITAAVTEAKSRGVAGVLLNGDIIDCGAVSHHAKDIAAERFGDEIRAGEQFIAWLRAQLPKSRIIYKEGNHENRLPRYICCQAPELISLHALQLSVLLNLENYGVEWVADKRPVMLGRLPVLHGHEFGGGSGGVNPARWLFLRATSTALCGHFHRTSQYDERALDGRLHGTWSVGCGCHLHPRWMPLNKWGHGFAFVEIYSGDHFTVTNKRLLPDGKVV